MATEDRRTVVQMTGDWKAQMAEMLATEQRLAAVVEQLERTRVERAAAAKALGLER